MNILYITQYYPPETGAGATRAEAISNHFAKRGWNVDVLCEFPNYPTGKTADEFKGKWVKRTVKGTLKINQVWVYATPRENSIQQLQLFGSFVASSCIYLMSNPKQYDLIYVSSPPISGAVTGALYSWLSGIPWVFEVRDLWPDAGLGSGTFSRKSLMYRISKGIEKQLYKSASAVVPVTRAAAEIVEKTSPGVKTYVVHNGVDCQRFKPEPGRAPADLLSVNEDVNSPKKFRVGYIGSIGIIHDFNAVVQAALLCKDDPEIEFVIIGDGSQRHKLQHLLDLHKPGNVKWLGLRPHEQVPAYINSFDLGINPVRKVKAFESIITVKFFEYLACDVPVISLAGGTLRAVGESSGSAITLPPGDYQGMAETIKRLKKNPDELAELKKGARSFVKKHFDRATLSERLADMLENFVKTGKMPSSGESTDRIY